MPGYYRNALLDYMMHAGMPPDPRNQVPGMGSAQNAIPYVNPQRDEKYAAQDRTDLAFWLGLLGMGATGGLLGAAQSGPAWPAGLAAGATAAAAGQYGMADQHAKRLQYQGN